MIQIIESVLQAPVRFLPDKKSNFNPGIIAQIIEIDGTPCCTVSDGTRPFGVVDNNLDQPFGMVPIWFDTMVFKTDVYEKRCSYEHGNPLYVSTRGLLTTKKNCEEAHLVGHVISGPDTHNYIEVNWI